MNRISPRGWTYILSGIALLALLLLASSLSGLELGEGRRIPMQWSLPGFGQGELSPGSGGIFIMIMRVVMALAWLSLPFFIIYLILDKNARKRFLRDLMFILPLVLAMYWLSRQRNNGLAVEDINLQPGANMLPEMGTVYPPPDMPAFTAPPDWVTTVTSLTIAVIATLVIVGIGFALWRRSRQRPVDPVRRVEQEAQAAIEAIESGGDLREVVIRCYAQMVEALRSYRNINRGRDITPHEFEQELTGRGLPGEPVHQLTQLFEQVRYGGYQPGRTEERQAVNSLTAIINACRRWQERQA